MTKISAFTSLTGANVSSNDVQPIVDVSDTSMAASGTTKDITMGEQLLWLQANGLPMRVVQTAAYTNNTTTASNISGLAFTQPVSGGTYWFKFQGLYQSAATTTGVGFSMTGPTTSSFHANYHYQTAAAVGTDASVEITQTTLTTGYTHTAVGVAATNYLWFIEGTFVATSTASLVLRGVSEVAASQITVSNGSGLLIRLA